jgi:hypothetical protein
MRGPAEKKTEGKIMKRQLSLVELATYGYTPARVNKGSWLEQTFGNKGKEVEKDEYTRRFDQGKNESAGR